MSFYIFSSIFLVNILFLKILIYIFFCLVHEEEMLKESQVSQEHLRAELEEAKISLQKAEVHPAYSFTV